MKQLDRRGFLRGFALALGGMTLVKMGLPSQALAQKGKAAGIPLITPNDPVAKAVGYIEDYKKSPKAKGNNCINCTFYAKKEMRDGKEVGTCLIFPGKYVKGEAYCNSWAKKA